jgi:uncharacterized membrane protein
MNTTTIGVFSNHAEAEGTIEALKAAGVHNNEISYVYKNDNGDVKDEQTGEKMGSGAAKGATTGAVIGAIAGLVVANGILPGIGTLFVAGPLATALGLTGAAATTVAGAATGAAAGGLIGALTGLGVDKGGAARYENFVRSGDSLLIVRSETPGVMSILSDHGATEIREYVED